MSGTQEWSKPLASVRCMAATQLTKDSVWMQCCGPPRPVPLPQNQKRTIHGNIDIGTAGMQVQRNSSASRDGQA